MQRCLEIWDRVPMAAIHLVLICVMNMINSMTHVFVISFFRYRVPVAHTVHRQHPAPVDVVGSRIFRLGKCYKLQLLQELGVTPPLGFWDPLGFSKFETPAVGRIDMAGLGVGNTSFLAGES